MPQGKGRAARWGEIGEPLGIAVLLALSLLPVLAALPRLGLYSDDYGILLGFEQIRGEPWPQIIGNILHSYATRPGQGLVSALLYFTFGLNPIPYALVETTLVSASVVLLWILLRRLQIHPTIAFGAAAIFCLLPQLSTVRIWFAALCVAMAMILFLAGALSLSRWLDHPRTRWSVLALVLWALSLSFYELFVPFMVAMVAYAVWRRTPDRRVRSLLRATRPLLPHLLLVLLAIGAKAVLTDRTEGWNLKWIAYQALKAGYDRETEFGFNAIAFVVTNYFDSFALPIRSLLFLMSGHHWMEILCAVVAGTLVTAVMAGCSWQVSRRAAVRALAVGFGASLVGQGIFVLVGATSFTAAGIGNRTAVASAIGVALTLAAAIMLIVRLAPQRMWQGFGSAIFGVLTLFIGLASTRISEHWASAYEKQQTILSAVRQDLSSIPVGSTILLDGICPYDGPAIVFETDWDVAGALSLTLARPVAGTVITESTRFRPDGILAPIYDFPYFYPYGARTYVYNPSTRTVTALQNWPQAQAYLAASHHRKCPAGYPGHGVPI